jgi:hypothetical protein
VGGICQNNNNTDPCDDGVPCTDAVCQSGNCVFSDYAGEITIDLDVEAISNAVMRDVTCTVTACGGSVDARVVPATIDAAGVATLVLPNIDAESDWISVREGHTLRRLAPLVFSSCAAYVDLTGVERLPSGDFQTGVVSQDNLVDITDFSILAAEFNQPVNPDASTGADATGDGVQGTADFTAIQVNFLTGGDPVDLCPASSMAPIVGIRGDGTTLLSIPLERVPVAKSLAPDAWRADLNDDGLINAFDIREFANRNGLPLLPSFDRQLRELEASELEPKPYRHWRR